MVPWGNSLGDLVTAIAPCRISGWVPGWVGLWHSGGGYNLDSLRPWCGRRLALKFVKGTGWDDRIVHDPVRQSDSTVTGTLLHSKYM